MAQRDLYEVLGVARSATADEIKAAYRRLARQLHPDVNKAADASQRFSEVQEAYDVLSDEAKRKLYDRTGRADFPASGSPAGGARGRSARGRGGAGGVGASGGFDPSDPDFDMSDISSMFDAFFAGRGGGTGGMGAGTGAGHGARRAPAKGPDLEAEIELTFEEMASGGRRAFRVGGRQIEMSVPPAVADGATLRLAGQGGVNPSAPGQKPGDLLVTVRVAGHPVFRRGTPPTVSADALDVWLDLPLTVAEAALGARVEVPTPRGPAGLTVPAGTCSGRVLRLKNQGLRTADERMGHLFAVAQVVVPALAEGAEALAEAARVLSAAGPAVRTGAGWPVRTTS